MSQWRNVHVPPLALCHRTTLKVYTPWTTLSVTVARNSSAYARIHLRMLTIPNLEIKHFKTSIGWLATALQVCKQRSGGNSRSGTFHQMRVTTGDTACSVIGVLDKATTTKCYIK